MLHNHLCDQTICLFLDMNGLYNYSQISSACYNIVQSIWTQWKPLNDDNACLWRDILSSRSGQEQYWQSIRLFNPPGQINIWRTIYLSRRDKSLSEIINQNDSLSLIMEIDRISVGYSFPFYPYFYYIIQQQNIEMFKVILEKMGKCVNNRTSYGITHDILQSTPEIVQLALEYSILERSLIDGMSPEILDVVLAFAHSPIYRTSYRTFPTLHPTILAKYARNIRTARILWKHQHVPDVIMD